MLFPFVLIFHLMVAAECSKLPENHEVIRELDNVIQRLQSRVTETEAKRDEEMKQMRKESNEVIVDLSEAIHRLEAKFAETEVRRDKELQQIKNENSGLIADLNDTMQRQITEFTEQQGKHSYMFWDLVLKFILNPLLMPFVEVLIQYF